MAQRYYRGQGKVFLGARNATGGTDSVRFLGNCPELMIDTTQNYQEHKESYTGDRNIDLRILTDTEVGVTVTMENTVKENWALAYKGSIALQAGATVTEEAHTAPAVGNYFALNKKNVTTLTSITSAPAGTTHVAGTDYVHVAPSNLIYVPAGSALAGDDILANYTAGNAETINTFTQNETNLYLIFEGLNTVESMKPVTIELFKVNFSTTSQLSLISDDLIQMQLQGRVLFDELRSAEGGYFSVTQLEFA
jgi:hypothetical protein